MMVTERLMVAIDFQVYMFLPYMEAKGIHSILQIIFYLEQFEYMMTEYFFFWVN